MKEENFGENWCLRHNLFYPNVGRQLFLKQKNLDVHLYVEDENTVKVKMTVYVKKFAR